MTLQRKISFIGPFSLLLFSMIACTSSETIPPSPLSIQAVPATLKTIEIEEVRFIDECAFPKKLKLNKSNGLANFQHLKHGPQRMLSLHYVDKSTGQVVPHSKFEHDVNNRVYKISYKRVNQNKQEHIVAKIYYLDGATGEKRTIKLPDDIGQVSIALDSLRHDNIIYFLADQITDDSEVRLALWSLDTVTNRLRAYPDQIIDKPLIEGKLYIASGKIYLYSYNHNNEFLFEFNPTTSQWKGINAGGSTTRVGTHYHPITYHNNKFYSVGILPGSYPGILRLQEFDPATNQLIELPPASGTMPRLTPASVISAVSSSIVWFSGKDDSVFYQYNLDSGELNIISLGKYKDIYPNPVAFTDNYLVFNARQHSDYDMYILDMKNYKLQGLRLSDTTKGELKSGRKIKQYYVNSDRIVFVYGQSLLKDGSTLWTMELDC